MAEFNPDAYLAAKAKQAEPGQAFDPDAYLASRAPAPGLAETAAIHAANGMALGAGPKIVGAVRAGEDGTPAEDVGNPLLTAADAVAGLYRRLRGDPEAEAKYQAGKQETKGYLEATRQANPGTAFVANVVGGAPTAGLVSSVAPVVQGAGLLPRVVSGLSQGATVGAAYGIGSGENAGDALSSTIMGGVGGAALPVAGAVVKKALGPAAELAEYLALKYGRKAVTGVSSPLARRKPLAPEAVQAAFDVGAIRPGSTVEGIAARLQDPAEEYAAQYGEILKRLDAAGVTGPNRDALAKELAAEATQARNSTIIGTRADALQDASESLAGAHKHGMHGPIIIPPKPVVNAQNDLGLMQAEGMKRELQNAAAGDFVKEGRLSLAGHARKEVAGRFREAIEDAVTAQAAKAPEDAAAFQPVKERLHRLLEASGAANEAAARSTRRSPFGIKEALGFATGIASGNPMEAVALPGAMSAIGSRSASTMAWGANKAAGALSGLAGRGPGDFPLTWSAALRGSGQALSPLAPVFPTVAAPPDPGAGGQEKRQDDEPTSHGSEPTTAGPARPVPLEVMASHVPSLQAAGAQGGKDAMAASHFDLAQKDERYRRLMRAVGSKGKGADTEDQR